MGGVAPHTTPVRAHQASPGTICAASWRVGAGSLVLRGPHGGRPLGRGGGSRSGSSLGRGGTIPPASGGGGRGPSGPRAGGGAGGGCRAAASPLPFWAAACGTQSWPPSCRWRAPSRRVHAVGAEVLPRGGGGEGRSVDRSPGGPCRPEPPLCPPLVGCGHGRVMWGAASILFRCARCPGTPVWARGSRSSSRSPNRVAPPAPGGQRAAPVAPQLGGGAGGAGGVWGALWSPGDAS